MQTIFGAALGVLAALAIPAVAQPLGSMAMPRPDADASPSSQAYRAADEKMMRGIMAPMSGDADRDFVAGMVPHHQAAVDMAKIELQYGKDPELRRLATGIIKAQETEIAEMKSWQTRHTADHK